MSDPYLHVTPRTLADLVWNDLFADLDMDMDQVRRRLNSAWRQCDETRARMDYKTGSITAASGLCLYALARRFRPREIFEVGTFIGKSAVAMAMGIEDADISDGVLYTCDGSNDFHLQHSGPTRIVPFPKRMSTDAFGEVVKLSKGIDLFHLDGRLTEADMPLMERLCKPMSIIAIDDFEGVEKGVVNGSALRPMPWLETHLLVYPPDRNLLDRFGIHSSSSTALLFPNALFVFQAQ